jgi:monoamine oxidase
MNTHTATPTALTRRNLLSKIGHVGGAGALAGAMQSVGMFGTGAVQAVPLPSPEHGKGRKVIVLGAGIAGLVAAYELEQAGFAVTVLEARDRIGGRAWTIRDGDSIEMIGEATQTAQFSSGIYFNAGPARLPSFHQGMLGYAKKFDVALEVEVNSSRSAYIAAPGSRIRMRAAVNDTRGYVSELLAKAINQGALDQAVTAEEKLKLLPFLRRYGDLDERFGFAGTTRSGFATPPGAGVSQFATPAKPVPLDTLIANPQLPMTLFEDSVFMQATMFQPVGGMDRIAVAIERSLRSRALCNTEVRRIRQDPSGIEVVCVDRPSGAAHTVRGDYIVCTIPFPVLAGIDHDLPANYRDAIAGVQYDYSNKIAFEAPRFWEAEQIYGGITFVGGETQLIWYPSAGLHSARGMLLGCYSSGQLARSFQKHSVAEQIALARAAIEMAHPGHGADCTAPLVVNWNKVPYSLGPWPAWNGVPLGPQDGPIDQPGFRLLHQPAGRLIFAGAALSQTPGWQEGAVQSAHAAVTEIIGQVSARRLVERPRRRGGA